MIYPFRIVNVFAESPLSGNPLCVFEHSEGLSTETMQALALQFNLAETSFILPSSVATAKIRIFTPAFEMPFAGHPTLGSAYVIRDLMQTGDQLSIETLAGIIPVSAQRNDWTLQARTPQWKAAKLSSDELAAMLGIAPPDLGGEALWMNTGSAQLLIPLVSRHAVEKCKPDNTLLGKLARNPEGEALVYVWDASASETVRARFFYLKGDVLAEDYGTGSACANLGGWFIATQHSLPLHREIIQIQPSQRASKLTLRVEESGAIHVTGRVHALGRGEIEL